jgi:hypothetical protein
VKNLTEILRARYSSFTTPTRNIRAALENSTSRYLTTNTLGTLGSSIASNSTLTLGSFSDDERFEASFRSVLGEWMDEHGKGIVEAVVKEAVKKDVKNASVKEMGKGSRERKWILQVEVDAEEEEMVILHCQG